MPGRNLDERSTSGEGLRLIPLEPLDRDSYRPLDDDVKPPWRKRAYSDPETGESYAEPRRATGFTLEIVKGSGCP